MKRFSAIWDTGATGTVITQRIVDECGLQPFGMQKIQGTHGGLRDRPTFLINIGLPNGIALANLSVILDEPAGTDVLIGMDIITLGDFSVTNVGGNTIFSFRTPSTTTVDFVQDARRLNQRQVEKQGATNPVKRRRQ